MTTTIQLTPVQHAILAYALEHTDGARKKVLDGLFNRALITTDGTGWFVGAEGYDAMGHARPELAPVEADPETEAAVMAAEATWARDTMPELAKSRTRENSKQAKVIRMLQRPEGTTIGQICAATGWQAHTVRGTFAGAFKKKLGLTLVSDKQPGGERVYRIA
ncbi:hypothetical protein AGMMS50225_28920 [Betaproteobacteria bacterium]|nr:hypothetical protein AGMMS50225_28920 [Betaproteobacteria bacterium]